MLFGIWTYDKVFLEGWKFFESLFWTKIGWKNGYMKKGNMKYIVMWDLPYRCQSIVISEFFAYFLLFLATIQYLAMYSFYLGKGVYPFLRIRMLRILECLPIIRNYYKKIQKQSGNTYETEMDNEFERMNIELDELEDFMRVQKEALSIP